MVDRVLCMICMWVGWVQAGVDTCPDCGEDGTLALAELPDDYDPRMERNEG